MYQNRIYRPFGLVFIKFFGISALEKYFEGRTIFSEENLKYERNDDPNMLVQHVSFVQDAKGLKNLAKPIFECFKDSGKDYNKTVKCIENVTFSKEEYINTNHKRGIFFLFEEIKVD